MKSLMDTLKRPLSTRISVFIILVATIFIGGTSLLISQFASRQQGVETPEVISLAQTVVSPPPIHPVYDSDGGVFVSPSGVDNTEAGRGSITMPYKTLAFAVSQATSGAKIVLRAGTYHEGNIGLTKQLTIQPYSDESVWLDGTVLQNTGWVVDVAGVWRLDNSPSQNLCKLGCYIELDPAYPMAGSPQMVFRDDVPLTEVESKSQVGPGKFFFDNTTNALYVGDNPSGHTIEVTVQKRALGFGSGASNSALQGIGIRRYGSIEKTSSVGGYFFAMVQIANGANNVLVENNLFYQSASRGLFVGDAIGSTIRGNVFRSNGMNGFDSNNTSNLLFEQNTVAENNAEHFSIASGEMSVVAGSKITRMSSGTIRDNIFENNNSTGWWCDLGCTGMTIIRNIIRNNSKIGIYYEVSGNAIIASNLVYDNQDSGIQVKGSNNRIYNNTLSKNLQNLSIWEDSRVGGDNDTRSNTVKNNIFSNTNGAATNRLGQPAKLFDIYGFNNVDSTTPDLMVTAMDSNAYYRSSASSPAYVLGWMGGVVNQKFTVFDATLKTTTGRESNGIGSDGGSNPFFIDEASANYQLKSDSVAVGAGVSLPIDIASAIGIASSPVNIGAIKWPGSASADNSVAICGTWALQQATSPSDLTSKTPSINVALGYSNIRGFSVRVPWNAVDGDMSLINQGKSVANSHDYSIRFMAGRWTPARVFNEGAYYYVVNSEKVPKPFSDSGVAGNSVFEQNYENEVSQLASWARSNNVHLLHLPWYGQDWAELNNGIEVRSAHGYSYSAWLSGHKKLIDIGLKYAGADLAIEFPMSGYGPLVQADEDLTNYIVSKAGANSSKIFVQANGWSPIGDWDSQEAQKDAAVWPKAVLRGEQAIQGNDYDWTAMYNILRQNSATYAEVYVASFQSNMAQRGLLATEITNFKNTACPAQQPIPTSIPTPTPTPTPTPQPRVYYPTDDVFVKDGKYANNNFKKYSYLRASNKDAICSTKQNCSTSNRHIYLKFNVSGLSFTPTSVKLKLYVNNESASAGSVYAAAYDTSWSENTLTWNTKPAIQPQQLATIGPVVAKSTIIFNLPPSSVQKDGLYTFVIINNDRNLVGFDSKEKTNKPELILQ